MHELFASTTHSVPARTPTADPRMSCEHPRGCGSPAQRPGQALGTAATRNYSPGLELGWGLGPGLALLGPMPSHPGSALRGDAFLQGPGACLTPSPPWPHPRPWPPAPRRQLHGQGESYVALLGGPLALGSK